MVAGPRKGEFPCRPPAHYILDNSGFGGVLMLDNHKQSTNHILAAYQNVEGSRQKPLDFHAPTKALLKPTSAGHQRIEDRFLEEEDEEVRRRTRIWKDERSDTKYDI